MRVGCVWVERHGRLQHAHGLGQAPGADECAAEIRVGLGVVWRGANRTFEHGDGRRALSAAIEPDPEVVHRARVIGVDGERGLIVGPGFVGAAHPIEDRAQVVFGGGVAHAGRLPQHRLGLGVLAKVAQHAALFNQRVVIAGDHLLVLPQVVQRLAEPARRLQHARHLHQDIRIARVELQRPAHQELAPGRIAPAFGERGVLQQQVAHARLRDHGVQQRIGGRRVGARAPRIETDRRRIRVQLDAHRAGGAERRVSRDHAVERRNRLGPLAAVDRHAGLPQLRVGGQERDLP